ncbi:hypothetical protein Q7C36_011871 [Tachysurus vachellii]|uniref:Uncharacterized protein n=1 Tax=Tachysurus vachellii TaxID=175792 RepID=A0AA88MR89_TACVA|nr:hypothetical protein Q7C36_011871 [Tachysurus vachellii]
MIIVIISLHFLLYWTSVLAEDNGVTQIPSVAWHLKGESAEMKCSHNKEMQFLFSSYGGVVLLKHEGNLITCFTTTDT